MLMREGNAELTHDHLEQSALPDAKWQRMRANARSGEAEFQYTDGKNSYLLDLANLPTFVPKQPVVAPPEDGIAGQKACKPKGHVGEPLPRRNQVGTVQQEGEATHCSFSEPIELQAACMLEEVHV